MDDPEIEVNEAVCKRHNWDGMMFCACTAAAREALKRVGADLQSVDGVLGLLHHRGLVDSERNRADVKAALEIVQRYTR